MKSSFSLTIASVALATSLTACSKVHEGPCEAAGVENDVYRLTGLFKADSVGGSSPLGDYSLGLSNIAVKQELADKYICSANVTINGTIGESFKGIMKSIDTSGRKSLPEGWRGEADELDLEKLEDTFVSGMVPALSTIKDKKLSAVGGVSYAIAKADRKVLAASLVRPVLSIAWLSEIGKQKLFPATDKADRAFISSVHAFERLACYPNLCTPNDAK